MLRSQCKTHLIEKYPQLFKKFRLEIITSANIQGNHYHFIQ